MEDRREYQAPELTDFGPIGKVTQEGPVGDTVATLHSSVIDPALDTLDDL